MNDYSESCMTIHLSAFAIHQVNIRPQVKEAVNLVTAHGHLIFLRGLCEYVWVNIQG